MNLIDKYMLKVTNTVTFSNEAKEIIEEIKELIEVNLDGNNSTDNVKRVLNELGDPRELALSYIGKSGAFIDTEWVPYYYRGLATSFKVAMLVVLIVHMILTLVLIAEGGNFIISIIRPLPLYLVTAPFVFTIVTLVFFMMSSSMTVEEYISNPITKSFKDTVTGSKSGNVNPIKSGKEWTVDELSNYVVVEDYQKLYKEKSLKLNLFVQVLMAFVCIFFVVKQPFLREYDADIIVDKYIPILVAYIGIMTVFNCVITVLSKTGRDLYSKRTLALTVIRSVTRLSLLFIILIVLNALDISGVLLHTPDVDITSETFFVGVYVITFISNIVALLVYLKKYYINI